MVMREGVLHQVFQNGEIVHDVLWDDSKKHIVTFYPPETIGEVGVGEKPHEMYLSPYNCTVVKQCDADTAEDLRGNGIITTDEGSLR